MLSAEVVVVELDLGALHHPVAEADEHVLDLAQRPDQEVARPDRHRRVAGIVTSMASVARPLRASRPLEARVSRRATARARRASLPARPRGRARAPAAPRSRAGSRSAPPCGRGSGPGAPRGSSDPAAAIAASASERNWDMRSSIGVLRRATISRERRSQRRRDVERLGAASRSGIVTSSSQAATTSAGNPSRSDRGRGRAVASRACRARAPEGAQRDPGPGSSQARREPLAEDRSHRRATAFGACRSAHPGPSTTVPSISAWALRIRAPTLPGSRRPRGGTTHTAPAGLGPTLRR